MVALVQLDTDSTARTLKQVTQLDTDGTPRALKQLWQNDEAGTPRLIFSVSDGISGDGASVSPAYVSGTGRSGASIRVTTTGSVTISLVRPSPTSLVWTFDDAGWNEVSPGALSTSFRSPALDPGEDASTHARVTATYAGFADAVSNTIILHAVNNYSGVLS